MFENHKNHGLRWYLWPTISQQYHKISQTTDILRITQERGVYHSIHSWPTSSSKTNSWLVSQFRSFISFFLEQWKQEYAQSLKMQQNYAWIRGKGSFPGGRWNFINPESHAPSGRWVGRELAWQLKALPLTFKLEYSLQLCCRVGRFLFIEHGSALIPGSLARGDSFVTLI